MNFPVYHDGEFVGILKDVNVNGYEGHISFTLSEPRHEPLVDSHGEYVPPVVNLKRYKYSSHSLMFNELELHLGSSDVISDVGRAGGWISETNKFKDNMKMRDVYEWKGVDLTADEIDEIFDMNFYQPV